jgi:transposase
VARTREIFETSMDEIARLYEGQMPVKDIADRFGVSAPTIANWLIKTGYKRRKKGRVPVAMKERARDLSGRGWSSRAIAELFKTSNENVEAWIAGEPTPPRPRAAERPPDVDPATGQPARHKRGRRWTMAQKDQVAGLLEGQNFPAAEIYWMTGASRTRQQRIWRELGVGPYPLTRPYEPCPPEEPPRPPVDVEQLQLEAFRRGVQAALAEANRLAIAAGQASIPGIEERAGELAGMSEEEFENEMERLEALKEFLALPPAEE